ncbi:MAG: DUF5667 domain-containing protein [Candidatus Curtissbacteria bacterium]|nr:DUF5667 domain-containing protein [Candidatus Curtissbacteria bacterium]
MIKKVLVCLVSFLLLFWATVLPVHAQVDFPQASDGQINGALSKIVPLRIIPSNPFYFLITGKEMILRVFQPSSVKRAEFDMTLSGKRLKEAYLLVANGDIKNASANMIRYGDKLREMTSGLDRAKSQNQDIANLIGEIAENLKSQEVLFFAIGKRTEGLGDGYNFRENYDKAAASFVDGVNALNNFRPGIRDRFKNATDTAAQEENLLNSAPKAPGFIEASASIKPNRIIY